MAVIQISRIQIRRGRALSGTGFPQLASGELGWAIDTQEMFIGNGSVAEGSPAVGNTKILTEKDFFVDNNMLTLIRHIYKSDDPSISTGPSPNSPIVRTLQQRLDDRVTTDTFGTLGNYDNNLLTGADDTVPLQRAIDQIFLNQSGSEAYNSNVEGIKSRRILELPAGRFKIISTINIPSYATLVGAGPNKTIIELVGRTITGSVILNNKTITSSGITADMIGYSVSGNGIPNNTIIEAVTPGTSFTINNFPTATGTVLLNVASNGPILRFVNDSSTPGNPNNETTLGVTQPKEIILKGFTVTTNITGIPCVKFESVKNSVFEDLSIIGSPLNVISDSSAGILMEVISDIVTCERNHFNRINISGFTYGLFAKEDINNNSFTNCTFTDTKYGISFGEGLITNQIGQKYGPRNTEISNCYFANIKRHAVYIENGLGNVIDNVKIENTGNNGSNFSDITYPQIYLGNFNNVVKNVVSDRSPTLGDPLYRVKTVRMDLNRTVTAAKGAYVVQKVGEVIVAEGFLADNVIASDELILLVNNNDQIFNTTNNLIIEDDNTPSDTDLDVRPTTVDPIAESNPFIPYIPEVAGHGVYQSQGTRQVRLTPVGLFVSNRLIKLPVNTNKFGLSDGSISYKVDYIYTSDNNFVRRGIFYVICNIETKQVYLTDEYDYAGPDYTTDEAIKLTFSARIVDKDGNNITGASEGPFSIVISYVNLYSGDEGSLVYSYTASF